MAQTNYTPISLYYSTTASAVPTAANLVQGELAINTNDGKLYYEDSSGVVQTLASKAGALGDVVGPASATDNALARFDLTTGKLIQNSVGILSDAGVLTGLTGLTSSGSITLSSLTSGRVTYAGASGLLSDSSNFTWNGTNLNISYADTNFNAGLTVTNTTNNSSSQAKIYVLNSAGDYLSIGRNSTALGGQSAIFSTGNFSLDFFTNSTQKMTITSAGDVGIGASSPATKLDVDGTGYFRNLLYVSGSYGISSDSASPILFKINNVEKMQLDASGNLLVGTTTASPGSGNTTTGNYLGAIGVASFSRASDASLTINTNTDSKVCRIYRSGSEVGDITVTTTTTSFNSTSDYRLKTVLGAVTGQGERIDALEPIEYTWNSNGLRTRGFLAHKFQEVYANSVTGIKDGVDANGKPEYQSMQASTSEVIADLVAEIQSLRQRITTLENK